MSIPGSLLGKLLNSRAVILLVILTSQLGAAGAQTQFPEQNEGNNPPVEVRRAWCGREPGQIAEVVGRVSLAGSGASAGVEVLLFNGFSALTTVSGEDGSYCLPLTRSTPGTFISVFATRDGFLPEVRTVRLNLDQPNQERSRVFVPEMSLNVSPRPGDGSLIGILYIRTVSGRPQPQEGILAYDTGVPLSLQGTESSQLSSGEGGAFSALLRPGLYRITTGRNVVVPNVRLSPGSTSVQLIFSGERINS